MRYCFFVNCSTIQRVIRLIGALIAAILFLFACTQQPSYPPAAQSGPDIVIDVAGLQPDIPQFHTYRYQGRNISYFLLKIDNRVNSFLDACASCYAHHQGYRYEDGAVTCRYCNMKFPIYKLEKGLGSCYPIKIEGRMEGGKYLLPVIVLEKETGKF